MPGEAGGWHRWRQQALRKLGLEMQQLETELEETRAVAAAKERLLLVHLAEME